MTEEQRAVLAYVVVDPDAWYAAAIALLGQVRADEALLAKVARWQAEYDEQSALPGYLTRAQRDAASPLPAPPVVDLSDIDNLQDTLKALGMLTRQYANALKAGTYTNKTVADTRADFQTIYRNLP